MTAKHRKRNRATSTRSQSRHLSISIIGAGRLGVALGMELSAAGHTINLAVTRGSRSGKRAAGLLRTKAVSVGSKPLHGMRTGDQALIGESELILVTTPDDSIPKIAGELALVLKQRNQTNAARRRPKPIVLHTSGALSSAVLSPLNELGFAVGTMHPLMSISGQAAEAQSFSGIHFSLEGDRAAVNLGKQLVRELGGVSLVIDRDSKPLYHAAALMASPNLTALIDIAIEILTRCAIRPSQARQMLLPLIRSTVENLVTQNPRRALTGTFKRGDIDTVRLHLAALAAERLTEAIRAYEILGQRSLTISEIPKSKKQAIESVLVEATENLIPTKRRGRASKSARRN